MHRYLGLVFLGIFAMLSACNTIEGAGRDVSAGGEAISETAEDVENDL